MIELINGDCMDYMRGLPDGAFDLGIVDPPYGIGQSKKTKYHALAFTVYKKKKWDEKIPDAEYFYHLFRVCKHQIIWGANYFVQHLPISKNWIVWDKLQPEGVSFSMFELAFFSGSGQAKIFRKKRESNTISNNKDLAKKFIRIHPAQKPIELYEWILKNYAHEGDRIFDSHLGSGSSAIACHRMGFDMVGIEIDCDYFDAAKKRLENDMAQLKFI